MEEGLMKRPSMGDVYVRRRAAEIIFPEVWGWLGREHSGWSEAGVMRDLMNVASQHASGYDLSKSLERWGWMPDDGLVDVLSGTWVQDAIDELTYQWVRCLNIRPRFAIGDRAAAVSGYRRGDECTVVRINEHLAQYGVQFEDTGKNCWHTINFEDLGPIAELSIPDKDAA